MIQCDIMNHIMNYMKDKKIKHQCNKQNRNNTWSTCCVCQGRLHEIGCTTKKNKHIDCCQERHQMLYDAGQRVGIDDNSLSML